MDLGVAISKPFARTMFKHVKNWNQDGVTLMLVSSSSSLSSLSSSSSSATEATKEDTSNAIVNRLLGQAFHSEIVTPMNPLFGMFANMGAPASLQESMAPLLAACSNGLIAEASEMELRIAMETALSNAGHAVHAKKAPASLGLDEVAVLKLYTMDCAFYKVLNTCLRAELREPGEFVVCDVCIVCIYM